MNVKDARIDIRAKDRYPDRGSSHVACSPPRGQVSRRDLSSPRRLGQRPPKFSWVAAGRDRGDTRIHLYNHGVLGSERQVLDWIRNTVMRWERSKGRPTI
jgi:hypothetical protein